MWARVCIGALALSRWLSMFCCYLYLKRCSSDIWSLTVHLVHVFCCHVSVEKLLCSSQYKLVHFLLCQGRKSWVVIEWI